MAPGIPSKGLRRQISHRASIIGALRARNPTEYILRRYPHIPKAKIRKWIASQIAGIKAHNANVASERRTHPAKAKNGLV